MPAGSERHSGERPEEYELLRDERARQSEPRRRPNKLCLSISVAVACTAMLLAFFIWYVVPTFFRSRGSAPTDSSRTGELGWINRYQDFGAEGSITLVDIDEDGIQDIVYSLAQSSKATSGINQPWYCRQYSGGCLGVIIGLHGVDGAELWNLPTKQEVFEMNCHTIDIDRDGRLDCLASGRKATLLAFNPRTGMHLWSPQSGKEPYFDNDWNIYNPLTLPDLNGDGVNDVFIAHGGDPLFPPENHTRFPARFMVLSGSDGTPAGNYFESPDGKETYNSPVLHVANNITHVLVGTGGETVRGSLYALPVDQLLCYAKYKSCPSTSPGVRELYRAKSKGVMVPVVLADLNGDEENDIICTTFDGVIVALDGKTYSVLWKRELPDHESYATPAVGYFNDDNRLDVMTVWNLGKWPDYSQCMVLVTDGFTGETLWSFTTSRFSMVSPLVLHTVDKWRDVFIVSVEGRTGAYLKDTIGVVHGIDPQRKLKKDPGKDNYRRRRRDISCTTEDLDALAAEVLLIDFSTLQNPLRIWRREVDKFYYDLVSYKPLDAAGVQNSTPRNLGCEVMLQNLRNTGAIGDVDGDGLLDMIAPFGASAILMNGGEYFDERMSLEIVKISIQKYLKYFPAVELNTTHNLSAASLNSLWDVAFLPAARQSWTAYMGTRGDSVYRSFF